MALVAHQPDADACTTMALFEQALDGRSDLHCGRVEIDALDAGSSGLANADCVVVFGRELQVLSAWTDLAAAARTASGWRTGHGRPVRIEIEPAAQWHPVLAGVGPFISHLDALESAGLPDDAVLLLSGQGTGAVEPVAWLRRRYGLAFHTRLGSVADFRQPAFVHLLLNAAAWVAKK